MHHKLLGAKSKMIDPYAADLEYEAPALDEYGEPLPFAQQVPVGPHQLPLDSLPSVDPYGHLYDEHHYSAVSGAINHLLDDLQGQLSPKNGLDVLRHYFAHPVEGPRRYRAF